jgi:hypothetical protein
MELAERARWALGAALGRGDIDWQNWSHGASLLAGALALQNVQGMDAVALTRGMEVEAERLQRLPRRPPLQEVTGEQQLGLVDLANVTSASLHFGAVATTFVGLVAGVERLSGEPLEERERIHLVRVVRSNLAAREVDRYLGAPREAAPDLPAEPGDRLAALEERAVGQLAFIQPDQTYRSARVAFIGELIHAVMHAHAIRHLWSVDPAMTTRPLLRLAEQVSAHQRLCDLRATQQYDELSEPDNLDFLTVLGQGFDDPDKLHFLCAARVLWEAHGHPEHWEPILKRTLAALE